jgi:hypothetical protein
VAIVPAIDHVVDRAIVDGSQGSGHAISSRTAAARQLK